MVYEYYCRECQMTRDVVKPVADIDREELCPLHEIPMERKISLSSFQLKGSGWFKDGYSKK